MSIFRKGLISKLILLNTSFFPFFVVTGAALVLLEAITYSGFVKHHLFLDLQVFFGLLVVSGYLTAANFNSVNGKRTKNFNFLANLSTITFPAVLVIGTVFISIERANYRGYVYTHGFHLDPGYFFYLYAIYIIVFLINISARKFNKGSFLPLLIIVVFFFLIYQNLQGDIFDAVPKLKTAIKHPFASTLSKGRYLFADFYDFMQFVNKYTPKDAVIMRMPQQGKWPSLSNDGYVRGFIYPRFTKAGDAAGLEDRDITYVFIHRAYGPPRVDNYIEKWPTFRVPAKRIIYMNGDDYTKPPIILYKDYDPKDHAYDNYWGIIELKK